MRSPVFFAVIAAVLLVSPAGTSARTGSAAGANPVIVFETVKGTIEFELFQGDAPKSVEHLLDLMKRSFYRGQRFHRVTASLVQVGDPQSRRMPLQGYWGRQGSGSPIGVFELSKKRTHVRGAVGLAHSGDPRAADSQIYFMKTASPGLDGQHAIIGRVTAGMAVVDKIEVTDMIKDARVK